MNNPTPKDLLTYEQASDEFRITVAQVRYLAKKGVIQKYRRGHLRGVYVSKAEVTAAIAVQPILPSDNAPDDDE